MDLVRIQPEVNHFYSRLKALQYLTILLFLFFLSAFWYLQVIHHDYYSQLAENNHLRIVPLRAPRGAILDCRGELLAGNRPSYNIAIFRSGFNSAREALSNIKSFFPLQPEEATAVLQAERSIPLNRPLVIREDTSFEEVALVESRKAVYPNLLVEVEPKRLYPYHQLAAPVIGHIGELNSRELEDSAYRRFKAGDLVGQLGIEKVYNNYLAGIDGWIKQMVNSKGSQVRVLQRQEPKSGRTITLTLDSHLQRYIESLFSGLRGAAVVLSPQSGAIMAMVNSPSFDPNLFSRRLSSAGWSEWLGNPFYSLQNRCIQNLYPPGSAFKLLIAIAALEEELITPSAKLYCYGAIYLYRHRFSCHALGGHGLVDLYKGIVHSCNVYFYQLGQRLGANRIAAYANKLGLGVKTGVDLPYEKEGLIPTPHWKEAQRGEKWNPGETISVAIGQGAVQVTPLQMAVFVSAIANGGIIYQPYLLEKVSDSSGRVLVHNHPKVSRRLSLKPDTLEQVRKGMWGVVNDNGTGWRAWVGGIDMAGKTGTAQLISSRDWGSDKMLPPHLRSHAWFVGFAPFDHPEVVVVVLVENGGAGGVAAAPIAGKIFEAYFSRKEGASTVGRPTLPTAPQGIKSTNSQE
ncbi:penicillin-binding protein 2 [bacterium (candidate division B38) B3_B38]|nr:MAG: penicillin-binding protein 2 [bacterium (candidate division B38) B3_B38]